MFLFFRIQSSPKSTISFIGINLVFAFPIKHFFIENSLSNELNSIKDDEKFDSNSIKLLYSLPEKSFALIYESDNIYLAKIRKFINVQFNSNKYKDIMNEQKNNTKQRLLKSYDELLNDKYKVTLNKKTIERVKNYFQ